MSVHRFRRVAFGLAAAALAAGCATQRPSTQVTRFHLGQPIARAEVVVEPRDPAFAQSLEYRTQADAVAAELARAGFRVAPALTRSELVAVVDAMRGSREAVAERSPVSIGLGGGSFGRNVGVGGGVSFPIGRSRSREVVVSEMSVQLKRRSEGTVVWEGRARTEARSDSAEADPGFAYRKLASAMFAGFPGESARTILVR